MNNALCQCGVFQGRPLQGHATIRMRHVIQTIKNRGRFHSWLAAVFLVLRFSDTGIQLLHMVMSGHSILARLFGSRIFVGGLLCASCACAAAIWGMSLMAISPLILAIVAQALLDLFRYPSSLSFLYQMRAFHLGRYVRFTLIPPVVSTVLSGGLILAGHPLALYVMVAAVTLTGAVLSARDARS